MFSKIVLLMRFWIRWIKQLLYPIITWPRVIFGITIMATVWKYYLPLRKKNSTETTTPSDILPRLPSELHLYTLGFLDINDIKKLTLLQRHPPKQLTEFLQNLFKHHRFRWPTEKARLNHLIVYFKRQYNLEYISGNDIIKESEIQQILDVKHGRVPEGVPKQWLSICNHRIFSMTYLASFYSPRLLKGFYEIAKINKIPFPGKTEYNELYWKVACQIDSIEKELAECSDGEKAFCLFLAIQHNHVEAINHLLRIKSDLLEQPFSFGNRCHPIHEAARHGHANVVPLLIGKGANVNATTNKDGFTPLHLAIRQCHIDIVRFLIEKGASFGAADLDGNSPPLPLTEQDIVSVLHYTTYRRTL